MKRFHVHVGVKDLGKSVEFYSVLFGQRPSKLMADYAKWMLEDPRINFAISTRATEQGVDHFGIQVDEDAELEDLSVRLKKAELGVYDEGETVCCYAESKKAWVRDPGGIPWEAYRTLADVDVFKAKSESAEAGGCCGPTESCCPPEDSRCDSEASCCED